MVKVWNEKDPIERKKLAEQLGTKYLFTHRIVDYLEKKYGDTMKDDDPQL